LRLAPDLWYLPGVQAGVGNGVGYVVGYGVGNGVGYVLGYGVGY
jgi:hypothetical protein